MELIVRGARLPDTAGIVDLGVVGGRIRRIAPRLPERDYGLREGARADFVLLDCTDPTQAVAAIPERLVVVKNGAVSVTNRITALGDAAAGWRAPGKGFEPHIIGIFAYPGGGLPHAWLDR